MSQQVTSNYNLQTINPQQFYQHLRASIKIGNNVFVIGRRGSGKSIISKDVIKEEGFNEAYINLSVFEKSDFGFPNFFDQKNNDYISYKFPEFWRALFEGNKRSVLLLDEVDKADRELWAPLLEILQFKTINGKKLTNLQAIIMTANFQSEGGKRPISPLLDRSEKYLLETSIKQWLEWAGTKGKIHPSITAYVADHPEDLTGENDLGEMYGDASPRSWENSSIIVKHGEEEKWPADLIASKVAGCVGNQVGIKYKVYFEHYQVLLPFVEKVMSGKNIFKEFEKFNKAEQMVSSMLVAARIARILDDVKPEGKNFPKELTYVSNFLASIDPEMALVCIRSQINNQRVVQHQLSKHKEFDGLLDALLNAVNPSSVVKK